VRGRKIRICGAAWSIERCPGGVRRRGVVRDFKHVAWLGRGIEVVTRVRDPRVVRICRININSGHETTGVSRGRGQRIKPRIRHRACSGICVRRDEDAASSRRYPESSRVARSALDRGYKASGASRPAIVSVGRQVGGTSRPDLDEVATAWLRAGRGKLGTVGLEIRLVTAPILRSPDAL